jgi:two-component system response regulator PilR (NtrC family)
VPPVAPAAPPAPASSAAAATPAPAAQDPGFMPTDLQAWLDEQEREFLVRALHASGFNRTAAAQRLGLTLRQIRYRIARLAIATPGIDDPGDERE